MAVAQAIDAYIRLKHIQEYLLAQNAQISKISIQVNNMTQLWPMRILHVKWLVHMQETKLGRFH